MTEFKRKSCIEQWQQENKSLLKEGASTEATFVLDKLVGNPKRKREGAIECIKCCRDLIEEFHNLVKEIESSPYVKTETENFNSEVDSLAIEEIIKVSVDDDDIKLTASTELLIEQANLLLVYSEAALHWMNIILIHLQDGKSIKTDLIWIINTLRFTADFYKQILNCSVTTKKPYKLKVKPQNLLLDKNF